jgi:hypothetical protein
MTEETEARNGLTREEELEHWNSKGVMPKMIWHVFEAITMRSAR